MEKEMDDEYDPLRARHLETAKNSEQLLKEHREVVGSKVRTRFPPEPNGYLHIGHAKSLHMNFRGAYDKLKVAPENRYTILRFDDTNPSAEDDEYVQSIEELVRWLGWEPAITTRSSDYFDWLYDQAVELIKRDKAYVCSQTSAEMHESREIAFKKISDPSYPGNPESPSRNRPVEESLRLFEDMRKGKFSEGEVCLRMKIDMTSRNPNEWDPVAYRIQYIPHTNPSVGDKWCVYPTYDFTHCLIDSKEHIDYSICTLEFETRRDTYYWLLDALDLYRPKVYEFARLELTYAVMSKRKILKLVRAGIVRGWDDPRLSTLAGFRRRGFTPKVINNFCEQVGVSNVNSTLDMSRLEAVANQVLDESWPRGMAVMDPLLVEITNFPKGETLDVEIPNFPKDLSSGVHTVHLSRYVYLDRENFRLQDDDDYKGLAPNKWIFLRGARWLRCDEVVFRDDSNDQTDVRNVKMLRATIEIEKLDKEAHKKRANESGGGVLHWVSSRDGETPQKAEIRLYERLLTVPVPSDTDWESQINPNSERVMPHALIDHFVASESMEDSKTTSGEPNQKQFQFERLGFFTKDYKDSTFDKPVFNLTLGLRSAIESNSGRGETVAMERSRAARMRQMKEKEEMAKVHPKDYFAQQTSLYSAFDEEGVPTHDAEGIELSKNARKKAKKEFDKRLKTYKAHNPDS